MFFLLGTSLIHRDYIFLLNLFLKYFSIHNIKLLKDTEMRFMCFLIYILELNVLLYLPSLHSWPFFFQRRRIRRRITSYFGLWKNPFFNSYFSTNLTIKREKFYQIFHRLGISLWWKEQRWWSRMDWSLSRIVTLTSILMITYSSWELTLFFFTF